MKDTMRSKLTQLVRRLEEIDQNLQDPDVTSNMDQFRALSKERAEIEPVVLKAKEYEQMQNFFVVFLREVGIIAQHRQRIMNKLLHQTVRHSF